MNASLEQVREDLIALLPRLRRFARTITRNVDDADDLVQLGLERALARLDQWRTDSRLDSWMFRILKNAWIDEVRGRKRRDRVFAPEEAGEHVGDTGHEAQEHALSVQAAMARLPEDQRLAVSLVLVEGLPYKEAAEVLGIPIGTLTSRLARGRESLQSMLGAGN
jgi:RNA polymerase sigma-70 factor (ECF subfamily)